MCDHHHHHDHEHGQPTKKELKLIQDFMDAYNRCYTDWQHICPLFCKLLRGVHSPVDLYEHNQEFRVAVEKSVGRLRWGRKASRRFFYAYVLPYGDKDGEVFTVQTNKDFDPFDISDFNWNAVNLMED